ncbi:hypothetical protein BVG19_g1318 [[Candida] boidinii]|nr:hypothetical protein BVG19_g1318 [[Candida] boidinii]OWB49057.1 hypothetical protein B5S27_g596 [[Candida] boidinii]OWB82633.1 hypothetical protein B5S33_g1261 [[Candida] boidinii]
MSKSKNASSAGSITTSNTSGGIASSVPRSGTNIQHPSSNPSSTTLPSSSSSNSASSASQKSKNSFSLNKTHSGSSSDGSVSFIQQQDPQSDSQFQSSIPSKSQSQSHSSTLENNNEFSNINSFSHIHLKPYTEQVTQGENKTNKMTATANSPTQHSPTPMATPSKSKLAKTSSASNNQDHQQHITTEKLLHPLSHDQLQSYNLQKQLQQKYQYSSPQSYSATLRNPHRSNSLQLPNLYETLGHLKKQSTSSSGSNSNSNSIKDQHSRSQSQTSLNDSNNINNAYSTQNNRSDISLVSTPTFVSISSQNNHHTAPISQHHPNLSKQQQQPHEENPNINNIRRKNPSLSPGKPTGSVSPDKTNQSASISAIRLSPSLFPVDYYSRKKSVASTSGVSLSSLPASLSSPIRQKRNSYPVSPATDIQPQEHIPKLSNTTNNHNNSSNSNSNSNFIHPALPDDPDKNIFLSSSHLTHPKHVISANSYVSLASAINQATLHSDLTAPISLVPTTNNPNSGPASITGSENERLSVQQQQQQQKATDNKTGKLNRKNSGRLKQPQNDYSGISNSVERLYSFITQDLESRLSSVEDENKLLETELTSKYNSLLDISNKTSALYARLSDVLIFLDKHKDLSTVSDEIINKIKILNDSMNTSKSIFEDEKSTLVSFENKINILENIKEDSLENKRYQNKIILLILIISLSSFIFYRILSFSLRLF